MTTAALVGLALIAGTAVSTSQAVLATRAEQRAREALAEARTERDRAGRAERRAAEALHAETASRREAEQNLTHARGALEQFFTLVSQDKLFDIPSLQPLRKNLLEAAVRYYEALVNQRPDDPRLLADLAIAHLRIAPIYAEFDQIDVAIDSVASGLDHVERLRREFPEAKVEQARLAGFWKPLRGKGKRTQPDDMPKVTRTLARLVKTYTGLHHDFPTVVGFESDLAAASFLLADSQIVMADATGADQDRQTGLASMDDALARWDRLCTAHPENSDYLESFLETLATAEFFSSVERVVHWLFHSRGVDQQGRRLPLGRPLGRDSSWRDETPRGGAPYPTYASLLGSPNHKNVSEAERMFGIAEGLLDLGRLSEAEKRLRQALSLNSEFGPAYNNLSLVQYERRELYEAAHAFNRAMQLMPGDPRPQYNLGLTLETGGRLNQAIFHYEQAHDLDPTNPLFLGNLLRARLARGDTTDDLDYLLRDLIVYDTRPEWIEWAEDELNIMLPKARRATERVVEPRELHETEPAEPEAPHVHSPTDHGWTRLPSCPRRAAVLRPHHE